MMGHQSPLQAQLFYSGFNLEQRVRANHPLRRVAADIDFEFSYEATAGCYGENGNVSIPPPVILKLMLLLVFYNVRSERELMATLPERLDWLWFLGYDLESRIPDHSVLSKARKRWGVELFKQFFERVVWACVQAGLVDGAKIFVDSSLIEADAAISSVIDRQGLKWQLDARYQELERRLMELEPPLPEGGREVNRRYVSVSDPQAALMSRGKGAKLLYKTHRAVDAKAEVITAAEVSRADVHDGHRLIPLWEGHRANTGRRAHTVVGDSHYGTVDNYLACRDRAVAAHVRELRTAAMPQVVARPIFPEALFAYDPATDTYRCPAGQRLAPKSRHPDKHTIDYAAAPSVCKVCPLRTQCTRSKRGARTVLRHERQVELDAMRQAAVQAPAKRDLRLRQTLMERSFARAVRFDFDHARWRGINGVAIQQYLIAGLQNILVLMRYGRGPQRAAGIVMSGLSKLRRYIGTMRLLHGVNNLALPSKFSCDMAPTAVA